MSALDFASRRSVRPMTALRGPGRAATTTPAATMATRRVPRKTLGPDRLRRPGSWRCGRACAAAGGAAGAAAGVAAWVCREKFIVGLPLVVGHGAEVGVDGYPLRLVADPR